MMPRVFEAFVSLVLRRPKTWTVIALAIMATGALLGTRIRFADDARALVADADLQVHAQLLALSEFTAVDSLLVVIDGENHEAELLPAAAKLVETLRGYPESFKSARYEVVAAEQLSIMEMLLPRRWAIDPRDPEDLFAYEALVQRLREARTRLLSPSGLVEKQLLVQDPLASVTEAFTALSTAPGLPKLDARSGRFFSQDGHSLLVVTEPVGNPFSGNDAARSMKILAEAEAKIHAVAPGVKLRVIGAHRFAHDAERIIRGDVHFGVITSMLLILAIFWLFFRRVRLVLVALPPLLFGACVAAGVVGLLGVPVHGIVLAFAGASLGLAIDYTVYFMATTAETSGATRDALPLAAKKLGISLPLLIGTTLAGLVTLCFSNVPAVQQMGIIGIGSVGGAFLGALIWVPIILPRIAPVAEMPLLRRGPWTGAVRVALAWPRSVLAVAVLLALGLFYLALSTRVDGDLRNLDTHHGDAAADEARFTEAFGDPGTSALAIIEAPSLEQALTMAERVTNDLGALGVNKVLSISALAPSTATIKGRHRAWCQKREARVERFKQAAVAAGFRREAFGELEAEWQTWCSAPPLVDPRPALAVFEKIAGRPLYRESEDGTVRLAVPFDASRDRLEAAEAALAPLVGVTFVHRRALNERLVAVIVRELPRLGVCSIVLVFLVLVVGLRGLRRPLVALAPAGLAVLAFFGVLAGVGVPLNLMSLCVLPLLNGSGVDYGVLMASLDRSDDQRTLETRAYSLTVAALTTMAGFGPLALADYYALASIGRSVLLAIGAAAFFALFLPPALGSLWSKRE